MKMTSKLIMVLALAGASYAQADVETKWTREITEECGVTLDALDTGEYGLGSTADSTPVSLNVRNNVDGRGFNLSASSIDETDFDGYKPNFIIQDEISGTQKPIDQWRDAQSFPFSQKELQLHAYTSSSDVVLPSESSTLRVTWQIECN
ncbi:hypothetical protein [Vibrio astriarenae]|uniref:hypothetical protein n=1 Tax=Vibrio astriarenae TaxID=1481923 RepID=UPI00373515B7